MRHRPLIGALGALGALVGLGACGFKPATGTDGDGGVTGGSADAATTSDMCATTCAWACLASPTPHCGDLVPGGGAVDGTDFTGTQDLSIGSTIDTGDGMNMKPKIDNATFGDVRLVAGITIFHAHNVHITGDVMVSGKLGLAIVATGTLQIDGVIAAADCNALVGGF
ncbi:MAG TPA: hypothetical protein VFQ65_07455, partial [Kofleriaceae bacterium]|nr:hypothetical protein [Kofleriaceae bacterium]